MYKPEQVPHLDFSHTDDTDSPHSEPESDTYITGSATDTDPPTPHQIDTHSQSSLLTRQSTTPNRPKMSVAVLIANATKFVNSHITRQLLSHNRHIIKVSGLGSCCSIDLGRTHLRHLTNQDNCSRIRLSITSHTKVRKLFRSTHPSQIVRLTTRTKMQCTTRGPRICISDGIANFLRILRNTQQLNIQRLIFTSADSICNTGAGLPFSRRRPARRPLALCSTAGGTGRSVTRTCTGLRKLPYANLQFFAICNP